MGRCSVSLVHLPRLGCLFVAARPNNALQRTESGGRLFCVFHALRRQPPSLSLGPLGAARPALMNTAEMIAGLRQRGWTIEASGTDLLLPADLSARYSRLPELLVTFLSGLSLCANHDQTIWFLCPPDYHGRADSAFRWNEFEQLSLTAAEGDSRATEKIRAFWDHHFPFMLSVRSGYEFFAVCTSSEHFGAVVQGGEPEFEEVSTVAGSFSEFASRLLSDERISSTSRNT